MAQYYYYNAAGYKVGPVEGSDLPRYVQAGQITPDTIILDPATNHRSRAGDVQGLFDTKPQTPGVVQVPPVPPQTPPAPPVQPLPPVQQPAYNPLPAMPRPAINIRDYASDYPFICRLIRWKPLFSVVLVLSVIFATFAEAGLASSIDKTQDSDRVLLGALMFFGCINIPLVIFAEAVFNSLLEWLAATIRTEINSRK